VLDETEEMMQFLASLDEDELNQSNLTDLMGDLNTSDLIGENRDAETDLPERRKSFFSPLDEDDDYDMPMTTPFTVHIDLGPSLHGKTMTQL